MFNPEHPQEEQPQKSEIDKALDKESEAFEYVQTLVAEVNILFGRNYGLSAPEEDLPQVVKGTVPGALVTGEDYSGKKITSIAVDSPSRLASGIILGEEMSHFYREYFEPNNKEKNTSEFFGWLGRRLFFEATVRDGKSFFFPKGAPSETEIDKKWIVEKTSAIKKEMTGHERNFLGGAQSYEELMEKWMPLSRERRRYTEHIRGYYFASKVDLGKITNWKKLYSMPDKEVRKRFFTPTPDYTGL